MDYCNSLLEQGSADVYVRYDDDGDIAGITWRGGAPARLRFTDAFATLSDRRFIERRGDMLVFRTDSGTYRYRVVCTCNEQEDVHCAERLHD